MRCIYVDRKRHRTNVIKYAWQSPSRLWFSFCCVVVHWLRCNYRIIFTVGIIHGRLWNRRHDENICRCGEWTCCDRFWFSLPCHAQFVSIQNHKNILRLVFRCHAQLRLSFHCQSNHWAIFKAAKQTPKLIGKMFHTVISSFQFNRKICKSQFSEHFFVSPNCLSSSNDSRSNQKSSRPPKQRYHNRMCRTCAHLIEMRSARATTIRK